MGSLGPYIYANAHGFISNSELSESQSIFPKTELPPCSGGNRLRLICMGKGILSPDTKSIQDCSVPVFHTHATPINVAVTPEHIVIGGGAAASKVSKGSRAGVAGAGVGGSGSGGSGSRNGATATASTGCGCVIQ